MPLTVGSRLGAYEVLAPIGRGAMGEVWRALDTRLGRTVALKILPESFAGEPGRLERFDREARLLAALDHPNIARIYDVEEVEGVRALVLELVTGESLASRIARDLLSGDLSRTQIAEAIAIARQVAAALEAAHQKGIVHRDLKPANVMLASSGVVKVLDFGLAKMTMAGSGAHEAPTLDLDATRAGTLLGTPTYMSPEQVRARPVDQRADIWAFGCLLYEMLVLRPAFGGESVPDILAAILDRQPDFDALPAATPDSVRRVLVKCLEKDVSHRAADIGVVGAELVATEETQPSTASSIARAKAAAVDTLAVLPFGTSSASPDAEYVSDGITENVINALAGLSGLRVLARSTVYRHKGEHPLDVGRALGVRVILAGTVYQHGDTLVVGAELVDVESGSQVWGQRYRRPMTDIFDLQEEIAREISDKLKVKLTGEDRDRLGKRHTTNRHAYEAYLRGRHGWNQRTMIGMRKAVEHFQAAIDLDPLYALAYAGLGDALAMIGIYHGAAPRDSFPRARSAARRALEIDEGLGDAMATLGFVQLNYEWDPLAAATTLREAVRCAPGNPSAHQWLAMSAALRKDFEAATVEWTVAQELDPFSASINTSVAWPFYWTRRTDEAIERLLRAIELHPHYWTAHYYLGLAYLQRGDSDLAIAALRKAKESSDCSWGADGHAYALAVVGRRTEAEAELRQLEQRATREYVSPYSYAIIHAGLGERDLAIAALEAAIADRSWRITYLPVDPFFDSLRADPRFERLASNPRAHTPGGSSSG